MRLIVCQPIGMLDDGQGLAFPLILAFSIFSLTKKSFLSEGIWPKLLQNMKRIFQGSKIRWAFSEWKKKEADGQSDVIFSPFSRTEGKQEK